MGFSLVELLVVLAIMSALAAIAWPLAELASRREKEEELRLALRQIRSALDAYKRHVDEGRIARTADGSGYPPSLELLVEGVEDARSPQRQRIYLLRELPADPFAEAREDRPVAGSRSERTRQAARTWGLRAYDSEPDDPREGADVYDVHSRSGETGLDGVPYRLW